MSYLNIISLAQAKTYLRVDSDLTDDDDSITAMIEAALSAVEDETQHIAYARSKTYLFQEGCVRVYDTPINSVTSPTTVESEVKPTYTLYERTNSDDTELVLNVGYATASDFPEVLRQYALYLIELYYYDSKGGENVVKLPKWLKDSVHQKKRFIF